MSKVNPVMKHASKILTPEQIAVENFMNTIPPTIVETEAGFVDNNVTEVLPVVEAELDPITDSVVAADNLETLATDVDTISQAPALESYKRIFQHMTQMSGHPATFSMEEFKATKGGVKKFARAIREHAALIRTCANLGLEDYIDRVDESVGTSLSNLKQVMGELNNLQSNLSVPEGNIEVNHKAVWELFHIDGKLIDLREFSNKEIGGIKTLAQAINRGKAAVLKAASSGEVTGTALEGNETVKLMQNLTISISGGKVQEEKAKVPAPDKAWTAGDWFWIFVFSWMGIIYRIVKGGSGEEKTKKEQSLKAIHQSIDEIKKLGPIVAGIDKDVDEIVKAISKAKGDQTALKQFASPVLDLANKTVTHVTAVCHGMTKVFNQFG